MQALRCGLLVKLCGKIFVKRVGNRFMSATIGVLLNNSIATHFYRRKSTLGPKYAECVRIDSSPMWWQRVAKTTV